MKIKVDVSGIRLQQLIDDVVEIQNQKIMNILKYYSNFAELNQKSQVLRNLL
ncbi:unnamed protein product [Paramecium primaurelia]|uniref:Uncharacterized protein n=1 Tax=Paramecium primaurelia TaxID=5886 RepID=A0A8S1QRW3_PARPR|nr:unnamed protein product [Paramecium primaurelia]